MSEQTPAGPDYPGGQTEQPPTDDGTNPATVGQEPVEDPDAAEQDQANQ